VPVWDGFTCSRVIPPVGPSLFGVYTSIIIIITLQTMSTKKTPETTAASTAIGQIGELVENILVHLGDIKTLAVARRVCRLWNLTTASSKTLKTAVFLEPVDTVEVWELKNEPLDIENSEVPIKNIIERAATIFDPEYKNDEYDDYYYAPTCTPGLSEVSIVRVNPLCEDACHHRDMSRPDKFECCHSTSTHHIAERIRERMMALQLEILVRPGQRDSRMEMLLTQPSCAEATYTGKCHIYSIGDDGSQSFVATKEDFFGASQRSAGVKIGEVIEDAMDDDHMEGVDVERFACKFELVMGVAGSVVEATPSEHMVVCKTLAEARKLREEEGGRAGGWT
jgi:hypothetical protein